MDPDFPEPEVLKFWTAPHRIEHIKISLFLHHFITLQSDVEKFLPMLLTVGATQYLKKFDPHHFLMLFLISVMVQMCELTKSTLGVT